MKKNLSLFIRALAVALVVCIVASCRQEGVKNIRVDNQFAISIFADTVTIGDLLNGMDSTSSAFIKVKEDGTIYAYYSDSIKNAVVAGDILSGLNDIYFESNSDFDVPVVPPSPVPVPVEIPLEDIFSIPFQYEGFEINSVVLKQGAIDMMISSNFNVDGEITLTTDNIKTADGNSLAITGDLDASGVQSMNIDLTDCSILPVDNHIKFSAMINATITDGIGGNYYFNLTGNILNVEFKTIDGAIQNTRFDFEGSEELSLSFPKLHGDMHIATPEFTIKYINTFGFTADAFIDSLYLLDASGNSTSIINGWDELELLMHPTGEDSYGVIDDIENSLVEEINLMNDYRRMVFKGKAIVGCEEVSDHMIEENSHIDIVADITMPLELNIDNLMFADTLDLDIDLNSGDEEESNEDVDEEGLHAEDVFDELEFKFVFENGLPLQIKPQAYLLVDEQVVDSLFDGNTYVHAYNGDNVVEDILEIHITDDRLVNVQNANKILLNIGLSSLGENVVINANDYFHLRIGLKTKTTEIHLDDLNF